MRHFQSLLTREARFPRIAVTPTSRLLLRQSSTSSSLRDELLARPANTIKDFLSSTPSHLLDLTISDFFPQGLQPLGRPGSLIETWGLRLSRPQIPVLPIGHHLVYFSPQVPTRDLLPDGTDVLHAPGPPFTRRMWAGGSLLSYAKKDLQMRRNAICREKIVGVDIRGSGEQEKVFVEIERRIHTIEGPKLTNNHYRLIEKRTLVFMKEKSTEAAKEDALRPDRIFQVPEMKKTGDVLRVPLIPTKSLLARFSALTFNAHGIHLDPQYAREVEGYRGLLVHGPLSLVLMLTVLQAKIGPTRMVHNFEYRNLAPLYVDEEMTVCVKESDKQLKKGERKYDVWIEGKEGGYAVKGVGYVSGGLSDTSIFPGTEALYEPFPVSETHSPESAGALETDKETSIATSAVTKPSKSSEEAL